MLGLWLRWSWRDLRARWLQVAAIAVIIALGTGSYAGLTSTSEWRQRSNDASYELTNVFDVRARLSAGSFVPAGTLLAALDGLEQASASEAAEERLIVATPVEVNAPDGEVFVAGRLIGVEVGAGGPCVNALFAHEGRLLEAADSGAPVVVLEYNFANHYRLPPEGTIQVAGGQEVRYVGQVVAPEYFIVVTDDGGFYSHPRFAVVFSSLETAQQLAGQPGAVNDLVLTVAAGTDVERLAADLEARLAAVGASVLLVEDDASFRLVTEDVDGDQQTFNVIAIATFAGAAFAAFNLVTRIVESQRREIGIAMALGTRPLTIALRPLLVGAQIALLGVVFGIAMGYLIGAALGTYIEGFIPLPVWERPFQWQLFGVVALIGFAVPFLAASYPVLRAVRVNPIDAIRTGHLAARGGGLAPLLARVRLPGGTFARMPFRNLLRAPRRLVLTAAGIAAAIAVLVAVTGLIDSYLAAIERSETELLGDRPQRLAVDLDGMYAAAGPEVAAVLQSPTLASGEPGLQVAAELRGAGDNFAITLQLIDFESALWRPTAIEGALDPAARGLVLAEKAASDLGVGIGDSVVLRHPVRREGTSFTIEETELPVVAIHPHAFRFVTYMDVRHADLLGLSGAANVVYAEPAAGASITDVRRQLFELPTVVGVETVSATAEVIRDLFEQVTGILRVIEGAVLALALLIAFNSASISSDERRREHATMFAFGVPLRTVMRILVVESFVVGVIGTVVGFVGGYLLLDRLLLGVVENTAPDALVRLELSPLTVGIALGLGVLAVTLAPLLTTRRLWRMDVPSTLRVME